MTQPEDLQQVPVFLPQEKKSQPLLKPYFQRVKQIGSAIKENVKDVKDLNKEHLNLLYGLYGALDGLSTSFSMIKYMFDAYFVNTTASSSDELHDWSLSPEGFVEIWIMTLTLMGVSAFVNYLESDDDNQGDKYDIYKTDFDLEHDSHKNKRNCYLWISSKPEKIIYIDAEGKPETIDLIKPELLSKELNRLFSKPNQNQVRLSPQKIKILITNNSNSFHCPSSSPPLSVDGTLTFYWPYVRHTLKAMKNVFKGMRNVYLFVGMLSLGGYLGSTLIPTSLVLGVLTAFNRMYLHQIKNSRKDAQKEIKKLTEEVNKETIKFKKKYDEPTENWDKWQISYNDITEDNIRLKKILADIQKKHGSKTHNNLLLFLAGYTGLVDAPYLFLGAVTLTTALAPWMFITIASLSVGFSLLAVVTRAYEQHNDQREFLVTQLEMDEAIHVRQIAVMLGRLLNMSPTTVVNGFEKLECGLIRMTQDPTLLSHEKLIKKLNNRPSYILFNSTVYYLDLDLKLNQLSNVSDINGFETMLTGQDDQFVTVSNENFAKIDILTKLQDKNTIHPHQYQNYRQYVYDKFLEELRNLMYIKQQIKYQKTLWTSSLWLSGLKNGLDCYGVVAGFMFSYSTILLMFSIPSYPAALVFMFVIAGLALMISCLYVAINYRSLNEEKTHPKQYALIKLTSNELGTNKEELKKRLNNQSSYVLVDDSEVYFVDNVNFDKISVKPKNNSDLDKIKLIFNKTPTHPYASTEDLSSIKLLTGHIPFSNDIAELFERAKQYTLDVNNGFSNNGFSYKTEMNENLNNEITHQSFFQDFCEMFRLFPSGGSKGIKAAELFMVWFQEKGTDGHYHDSNVMIPIASICAVFFAFVFASKGYFRLSREKKDGSITVKPESSCGNDSAGKLPLDPPNDNSSSSPDDETYSNKGLSSPSFFNKASNNNGKKVDDINNLCKAYQDDTKNTFSNITPG